MTEPNGQKSTEFYPIWPKTPLSPWLLLLPILSGAVAFGIIMLALWLEGSS